ncbi:DUF397 domain-containing protein [Saccharothrix coeruleofusca]|uniref:DUF397 domain-containing protein n=1 Tax=Saccharothrix coeruleofusca TaxID=33919 RepID=A0A918AHU4_9PSEU|nr:DUF397 domain-containing protein [Saccharothrix coeruleofusca]GGP38585.1 hypothetical protein GCM10010185_07610 [Saccharothrix coeruleofusca]
MTAQTEWRTSSYSGNANECVEVALDAARARIRDTKARGGGTLTFTSAGFAAFREMIADRTPAGVGSGPPRRVFTAPR